MPAIDHVRAAARILGYDNPGTLPDHKSHEASSHARVAIALALGDLAEAAKTDTETAPVNQEPWPEGVTARLLTRIGMRSRDFADATVDIHDSDARSIARCRPCGWTRDHGLPYRDQVLEQAREHAAECTALPNPAA